VCRSATAPLEYSRPNIQIFLFYYKWMAYSGVQAIKNYFFNDKFFLDFWLNAGSTSAVIDECPVFCSFEETRNNIKDLVWILSE
jgi:hypothetical protein